MHVKCFAQSEHCLRVTHYLIDETREPNDLLIHQSTVDGKTYFIVYRGVEGINDEIFGATEVSPSLP